MTRELAPVTYGEVKTGLTGFVIAPRGAGQVNIYNGDITDVLLVSKSPTPVVANSLPVQPLTNATIDTTNGQYYASAAPGGGSVLNVTVSAAAQLSPSPAQIAQQISALGLATAARQDIQAGGIGQSIATDMLNANKGVTTEVAALVATGTPGGAPGGVPVLRGTVNLGTATGSTLVGGGVTTLLSNVAITKPSFEAIFQLNLPAGVGTQPFVVLGVQWTDSNTGLVVGFKQYILTSGNGPANSISTYLSGPCRGNQLTLTLSNLDPAQTLTYTWALNQTSHVYSVDRLLQPNYASGSPVTFQNPGGNPSKGALLMTQASINAGTTLFRLTAACNAKCKLLFDNTTTVACNIFLQDPGQLYNGGTTNQNFYRFNSPAQTQTYAEIQFPNGPLQLAVQNTGGSAVTPGIAITIMEY